VCVRPIHFEFFVYLKFDSVFASYVFDYLIAGFGFLALELIARETNNHEAFVSISLVQLDKTFVLPLCERSLRCNVNYHHAFFVYHEFAKSSVFLFLIFKWYRKEL